MSNDESRALADAELESVADDFLRSVLGWPDGGCGLNSVFSFERSLSDTVPISDNFSADGPSRELSEEEATLIRVYCNLWFAIDWSKGDTGPQIAAKVRLASQHLAEVAVVIDEKWAEDEAYRTRLRREAGEGGEGER